MRPFLITLIALIFSGVAHANIPQACQQIQEQFEVAQPFKTSNLQLTGSPFQDSAKWLIGFGAQFSGLKILQSNSDLMKISYKGSQGQVTYNVYQGDKLISYSGKNEKGTFEKVVCSGMEDKNYLNELFADIVFAPWAKTKDVGMYGQILNVGDMSPLAQRTLLTWLKQAKLNIPGKDYLYTIRDVRYDPSNFGVVGYQISIATKWQTVVEPDDQGYVESLMGDGSMLVIDIMGQLHYEEKRNGMEMQFAK